VQSISSDSPAEASGLQAGDKILLLGGQPPLSIADVQWVLHQTDEKGGSIPMVVQRDGSELNLSLDLEPGWRQAGDISWRVTMWSLRRMVLGGMVLETEPSTSDDHDAAEEAVAIRVKRMGQNGPHGAAKRAGFQEGDLLVSYDGHDEFGSEAEVINYAINHHVIGVMVSAFVRRGEEEVSLQLPMQP
jgi:S1-C subfamily serine protease